MEAFVDIIVSLVTLTILEIVLGIDNLVFLAIISQKLPKEQQKRARQFGLILALGTRLLLLASAVWMIKLTTPLFSVFSMSFSGRDIFLFAGGIFLLLKSTQEIHAEMDPDETTTQITSNKKSKRFSFVVIQIAILDIIFSLDSVLTAIGLTQRLWLMSTAIVIAIMMMLFASEPLSRFVERHPTIKMLALSFLILIGMVLIADSFQFHIPRGYIYFAMAFSLFVEMMNLLKKKRVQRKKASIE